MMYSEVAWVLVSSGNQVQPQIILQADYLPDILSVSYDYGKPNYLQVNLTVEERVDLKYLSESRNLTIKGLSSWTRQTILNIANCF